MVLDLDISAAGRSKLLVVWHSSSFTELRYTRTWKFDLYRVRCHSAYTLEVIRRQDRVNAHVRNWPHPNLVSH
jgi:hypothetical protein